MYKNQTVIKIPHQFALVGSAPNTLYKEVVANYTPPITLYSSLSSIVPTYSRDRKFYTPAFVIPRLQNNTILTPSYQRKMFQQKVMAAHQQTQETSITSANYEIQLAIPSSSYCKPCEQVFTDYHEHIHSPAHLTILQQNRANQYIKQLARLVSRRHYRNVKGYCPGIKKKGNSRRGSKQLKSKIINKVVKKENRSEIDKSLVNTTHGDGAAAAAEY